MEFNSSMFGLRFCLSFVTNYLCERVGGKLLPERKIVPKLFWSLFEKYYSIFMTPNTVIQTCDYWRSHPCATTYICKSCLYIACTLPEHHRLYISCLKPYISACNLTFSMPVHNLYILMGKKTQCYRLQKLQECTGVHACLHHPIMVL